jgi:tetratricopeptide (TPR) repeat protein
LFIGIISILGGLNLIYLFTFSQSTPNLVLAVISIFIGLIFIISYKFPEIFIRFNINRKQSQEIIEYNKTLKINSKDTTAWNNKGTVFAKIGRYQEAINCFDKVLEIDPMDAGAWHNKGVIFDNLRNPKEAIKHYDKALALDPKLEKAKQTGKIILES